MLQEFKKFAMKGNVMDLAVGVVIGGAFQKIVTSLVEDIIMPCVSILTGKIDFSNMIITVGNATIKYGNFITAIVNFLIISFSIFLVVKYLNKLNNLDKLKDMNDKFIHQIDKKGKLAKYEKKKKNDVITEPETKICPFCLTEIKYKATRCPHCTSELPNIKNPTTRDNKDISLSKDSKNVNNVTSKNSNRKKSKKVSESKSNK